MKRLSAVVILALLLVSLASGCTGSGTVKEKIEKKVETLKPQILSVSNRWGEITPSTSEIITEIVVYNPNSIPIPIKAISVHLYMNGIDMGAGKNVGPASLQPKANTTIVLSTKIDNTKIPTWWVSHLRSGEKTEVILKGSITFDLKVTDFKWPFEQKTEIRTDILRGLSMDNSSFQLDLKIYKPVFYVTLRSQWGSITSETTEIRHHVTIYNPQQIPFVLSNIGYEVYMNDILMGEGTLDETVVLKPRASTDVLLSSFIDNTKLGEWWYTHLKNGEKSTVLIKLYWVFDVGGTEIKVPLPMDMKSEIKTDILGGS